MTPILLMVRIIPLDSCLWFEVFPSDPLSADVMLGFPGGSDGKESACKEGDSGSVPGLERSPAGGDGNPLRYSCLENSMDRGDRQATVHGGRKESDMTEWLTRTSDPLRIDVM